MGISLLLSKLSNCGEKYLFQKYGVISKIWKSNYFYVLYKKRIEFNEIRLFLDTDSFITPSLEVSSTSTKLQDHHSLYTSLTEGIEAIKNR